MRQVRFERDEFHLVTEEEVPHMAAALDSTRNCSDGPRYGDFPQDAYLVEHLSATKHCLPPKNIFASATTCYLLVAVIRSYLGRDTLASISVTGGCRLSQQQQDSIAVVHHALHQSFRDCIVEWQAGVAKEAVDSGTAGR